MDLDSSLNEELKSLVNEEFKNYIPVPSLAESSEFGILYFCTPVADDQSTNQSWFRTFSLPILGQAHDSVSRSSANLISLGWLFDHCPDNSEEVNAREEEVCIQGLASASQKNGSITIEMSSVGGCGASASCENNRVLDLGKIVKFSVPYKQIIYWLKRVTPQDSPELFREAKRSHLYIIYEVLTAEHLKNKAVENSNIEGSVSAMVPNGGVSGSGTWKRNKDCRLSRPKSMGRYPFAYKCGRVRVKKNKSHLKLVGLREFYNPYKVINQNKLPTYQSPSSSQDDEMSRDEFIVIKTEDKN